MSVNQRLLSLGAAAFVGFGAIIGVGWYQSSHVSESLARQQTISEKASTIASLKVANLELVLAAMDAIVDKNERQVAPERIEIMKNAIALMREKAQIVADIALLSSDPAIDDAYENNIATLEKAVLVALPQLIESGAAEDAFVVIDDAIDGAGDALDKVFQTLSGEATKLSQAAVQNADQLTAASLYWQIGLGLLGILVMGVLYPIHSTAIRRGVSGIQGSLEKLRSDDIDQPVEGQDRGDEFGAMASAAEQLRLSAIEKRTLGENVRRERERNDAERSQAEKARLADADQIQKAVSAIGDGLSRLADGDMTVTIDQPFRDDLERVRLDFNRAIVKLHSVIADVKSSSGSIGDNCQQMRSAADDLARRTEQQAASLEQTSAALSEITETVKSTSSSATQAATMVDSTKSSAEKSRNVVGEAMEAMQRIENASNEIGKIINVIDEIAFQTNLLALNAGVEAARAGEAGKGFAVVAQEVRELAGRAAGAAKDIKHLVTRSSEEVRSGVDLVTATGEALSHIAEDVAQINEIVRAIATSAKEQSVGVTEISTAISQMDQMTQQNAAMVEETNAASHTLAQDAGSLTAIVSQFKLHGVQAKTNVSSDFTPSRASAMPKAATSENMPKVSPARNLVNKLAGAFSSKPVAQAVAGGAANNWEEF